MHGSASQVQNDADFLQVRFSGHAFSQIPTQDMRSYTCFNLINFRYYSGEKKAPVLTIFIGGNHEASNHLQELPYGGWVAPNIYFLGKQVFTLIMA